MSEPYLGEIRLFSYPRIPRGWMACEGQLLPISSYQALFSLLGTNYGGDGRTTFALPDMRGRAPMHFGDGPGLSLHPLGQRGGVESVTLNSTQMPNHSHAFMAVNQAASTVTPGATVQLGALANDTMYDTDPANTSSTEMDANAIGRSGNGLAHDNMMPTLTVSFCIATAGIFPSRN